MTCAEVRARLEAYADDECDPQTSREIALHLASCAGCAAAFEALRALGERLRAGVPYHAAPDALRSRLAARAAPGEPAERASEPPAARPAARTRTRTRTRRTLWGQLTAAAGVLAVVGAGWLLSSLPAQVQDVALAREAVSAHVRSLMAGHLTDVASTDQHTVKPWFGGRVDFSPNVTDFAAEGYPLVGGRLDYVGGRPVAALVYMRRKHVINLFEWPGPALPARLGRATTDRGYHVLHGRRGSLEYWWVSDLNPDELTQFAQRVVADTTGR